MPRRVFFDCQNVNVTAKVNSPHPAVSGGNSQMPKRTPRWLTAQEAAALLDSTSAQICDLLRLGRLSGIKKKQPGRAGKEQWLVNPRSIAREKQRLAKA